MKSFSTHCLPSLVAMLVAAMPLNAVKAITITSVANGNWSNTATWDCGCVPGASDDVIVAHDVTLDVDIEVEGPFTLTVNAGKSLVGNSVNRRIGYDLTAGMPIVFTNNGTFTIGILNRTGSGSTSNDDWIFNNNGTFTIQNTDACSGSGSPFAIGYGVFYNNAGATLIADGCFYVGGAVGTGLLDNSGEIIFNGDYSAHSTSGFVNHPSGVVTINGLYTAGGLNQDNYGCINAAGGFRVFEKTNNGGNGRFTMHDDAKLIVAAGTQFNVNSNTTLEGVDDDGIDANNGCVSSGVQINNNGTITGEFYLNDPDGMVGGTVGGMVVLGTGDCGGVCSAAAPCMVEVTSATPSACDPGTNTYSLDVVVTYSDQPAGDITINVGGTDYTFTPDGTSPDTYTVTGLTANGTMDIDVSATFVGDPACTHTLADAYDAPVSCAVGCAMTVTSATPSACDPGTNTYSLDVVVTYSNAPGGNITVNTSNGGTITVAQTTSPQTITLTGLTADGVMDIDVTAFFVAEPACTDDLLDAYDAPASCLTCPTIPCGTTTAVKN